MIRKLIDYVIDHDLQRLIWRIIAKLSFGISQALIAVTLLGSSPFAIGFAACFSLLGIALYIFICLRILKHDV